MTREEQIKDYVNGFGFILRVLRGSKFEDILDVYVREVESRHDSALADDLRLALYKKHDETLASIVSAMSDIIARVEDGKRLGDGELASVGIKPEDRIIYHLIPDKDLPKANDALLADLMRDMETAESRLGFWKN